MLNFSEFLKEDFLIESKEVSHRGTLNEVAFVHAFERYNDLMQKHKGNHEKAIRELANEPHVGKFKSDGNGNAYSDRIDRIADSIGRDETDRTLWDSHHAAVATINHIHKNEGGIAGPAEWTGGDVSGETVKKITGINSNADILIPTGNGDKVRLQMGKDSWKHGSLKYSKDLKSKPTKLFQGNARELVEKIQDHHQKHFGKRDEELDNALSDLNKEFGSASDRIEKHSDNLSAAGFSRKADGSWPTSKGKGSLVDQARYAWTALNGKTEKDRNERRAQIEEHLRNQNIHEDQFDNHIRNMANVHEDIVGDKKGKSAKFMSAVTNALNKSYSEASGGQNALLRDLLNIRERRRIKSLIIKTQRNDKIQDNYEGNNNALPKVGIANHGNDLEALFRRGLRQSLPESKLLLAKKDPQKETASSTITKTNGKNVANMSVDSSGSSPSVIVQAGNEIDNFKDVSKHHPAHPEYNTETNTTNQKIKTPEEQGSNQHGPIGFSKPDDPSSLSNRLGAQQ